MIDVEGERSGIQIYCEGSDRDAMLLISGIEIPAGVQIN
jgi:hypothetical protein